MNKSLLILSFAALALASCSDDEPLSTRRAVEEPISFRASMGNLSRATETTNANLASIYVTSFIGDETVPYFHDMEYAKGSDGFFSATGTAYVWPGDTSTLHFQSYAPSQDALGADITMNGKELTLENYVTPELIADQVDFITAEGSGTKKVNETAGVPLTFKHRLAQVEVRAKTDNTAYVYKVAGMRIGRPETTGSFSFATNEWTLDDWHDTFVYESSCDTITLESTPASVMGESGNAMLIPQTLTAWMAKNDPDNVARGAYLSVALNISTPEGVQIYPFPSDKIKDASGNPRKFAWASIPLSGTWEQGKKYIYILDFTDGAGNVDPDDPTPGEPVLGGAIKFTVNVEDWQEANIPTPMTPVVK
ncbi:MAG: fimbrillin family protein [Muribaculaceae bacterium]|nr:fimbrillin family protein [Muribaculaceae bacterium]